jgi:hypothetical protein
VLSSEQPLLQYVDDGVNAPPVVTTQPFAGLASASRGIVNVSAGGHVRLFQGRGFRLHAGIGSNQSQVAPDDAVFTAVDLTSWSVGVSGTLGNFRFSVGMNRQSGSAEDVMLRNLVNGDVPRRCSGRPERPVEGRRARRPRSRKSFVSS